MPVHLLGPGPNATAGLQGLPPLGRQTTLVVDQLEELVTASQGS